MCSLHSQREQVIATPPALQSMESDWWSMKNANASNGMEGIASIGTRKPKAKANKMQLSIQIIFY
jgi:hypothetical protein